MGREALLRYLCLNRLAVLAAAVLAAGGCATPLLGERSTPAGVRDPAPAFRSGGRPPAVHVVREGENLYTIAMRYRLDHRSIVRWNRIRNPDVIHPGQRLVLRGKPAAPARASAVGSSARNSAAASPAPRAKAAAPAPRAKASASRASAGVRRPAASASGKAGALGGGWASPAKGRVVARFGKAGSTGIAIAGRQGQPVMAAKGGSVVYIGSGLVGYGRLVIVKHSARLLTAYAHNDRILVKEGQAVRAGQKIAEMGSTGTDRVKLHFEVRLDGKPVNPTRYLPG